MTLPEFSIKRHVLTFMLSAVIMLFGIIAYDRIGVDRIPSVDFPVINITTTMRGASADIMDTSVTNVIESAVNTTPGIEHIQSSSSPGASVVGIVFNLDKDIDVAFNEVQAKLSQVQRRLPDDADAPTIWKVDSDARPIIWIALTGDRTIQQLNLYAKNVIKKKFETINGVGEVRFGGKRDRVIRIVLSPEKMAAYKLGANDLIDAFNREHIKLSGGFLVSKNAEQLIKVDLEFHKLSDLENMVVQVKDGNPIYLKDVANVEDGLNDRRQIARYNGQPTVSIGIVKIANTNTVEIIREVKKKLDEEIRPNLPPGMALNISTNDSIFINQIVSALQEHLVEGTLFAALIVLIFMRSFSSTLMICLEIPVSLLGAIAVMYFAGYTFNSMTLLALLLLIGVVVDDAIVVRESILRHMSGEVGNTLTDEELKDPTIVDRFRTMTTIKGSNEVVFAVFASSAALVCIFAPVIFMEGIVGMFFESFAVVVTFGVIISLLVSLTLTPMLCSRYLSVRQGENKVYTQIAKALGKLDVLYKKVLSAALSHRWLVLLLTVTFVIVAGFFSMKHVEKEFVPDTDESYFRISAKTPLGSSLDYTDGKLQKIEAVLKKHPDVVASYYASIGTGSRGQANQASINVRLKPRNERHISQQDFIKSVQKDIRNIPGIKATASPPSIARGQRSEKLQFILTGNNLEDIGKISQILKDRLNALPEIGNIDTDVQLNLPQLDINVDRTLAANLGLNANNIATTISAYSAGINVATYNDAVSDGERYDVRFKAGENTIQQVKDLSKIYLRNNQGQLVRLDAVASFEPTLGPAVIGRYDLQYAVNFYSNPTVALSEASALVEKTAAEIVPPEYTLQFSGQAEEMQKTINNMAFVFTLATILLYMVLASQFNSFTQPFVIMLAQPLAIIGGLVALWLTGQTLNIYSMIGLVLLIGLVAKNSILLIDLTNQLRSQGASITEALSEACPVRLRPVLMTSLTVILALTPAAIGLGAGNETNKPLSIAIIGGMVSSTLLTLVVVPAAYSLLMHGLEHIQNARFRHQP
jgi:HAE1 family hydrophobic/amphiphilic exporter-1